MTEASARPKASGHGSGNPKSRLDYSAPKTGFISSLPSSWIPFAELARIDKPAGIYLFYFPHLFGTLFAALNTHTGTLGRADFHRLLEVNAILLLGTAFFRASACSWNDTMDMEFDRKVQRCRNRPLARGALEPWQAHILTVTTALLAAACLGILPLACWVVAIPSIFLLWLYPFAKRFTDFPQAILGVQVAIGFLMGIAATNGSILVEVLDGATERARALTVSIGAFYIAQACWTVIYDTVYAQQDVEDDAKAGVRSIAIRFRGHAKTLLWSLSVVKVILLVVSGYAAGFGVEYMAVTCGGVMASFVYMLVTIDLHSPADCAWWFKNGCWFVAASVTAGLCLGLEYGTRG